MKNKCSLKESGQIKNCFDSPLCTGCFNNTCDFYTKATSISDRVYQFALDTVRDILDKAGFELHEFVLESNGSTAGFAVIDVENQEVIIPVKIRENEYESPVPLDEVIKWATDNNLCLKKE